MRNVHSSCDVKIIDNGEFSFTVVTANREATLYEDGKVCYVEFWISSSTIDKKTGELRRPCCWGGKSHKRYGAFKKFCEKNGLDVTNLDTVFGSDGKEIVH